MSRKRFNPLENPPAASSSDEDEVDTSIGEGEEVEESSSEEEEDDASSGNPAVKKPETALVAAEKNRVSDSESGSEEETDSDNETERKAPVKNPGSPAVKSVAGTKDSVAAKSQDSKKVKSSAKSATKKRPSETDVAAAAASADAKRVKRVSGEDEKKSGGEEETKKTYFQRIWTEDDEISVLQGVIDYETDTGASPFVNSTGFYESVKKSISFEVRKIQLMEKVRGLKKKFENNRCKGKKGEDPTFAKPHDRKAFELSKIIWGENGLFPESAMKSNGKSKKSSSSKSKPSKEELISSLLNGKSCEDEVDAFVKPALVTSLARFGVDDLAAQQGWNRLASEDKKRFEEEWEQLQLKEFEFYSQRSGFFHAVVTKMAETFRPST